MREIHEKLASLQEISFRKHGWSPTHSCLKTLLTLQLSFRVEFSSTINMSYTPMRKSIPRYSGLIPNACAEVFGSSDFTTKDAKYLIISTSLASRAFIYIHSTKQSLAGDGARLSMVAKRRRSAARRACKTTNEFQFSLYWNPSIRSESTPFLTHRRKMLSNYRIDKSFSPSAKALIMPIRTLQQYRAPAVASNLLCARYGETHRKLQIRFPVLQKKPSRFISR